MFIKNKKDFLSFFIYHFLFKENLLSSIMKFSPNLKIILLDDDNNIIDDVPILNEIKKYII
jgi:hypothetical protein